ncbi:MAG: AMP-binding protein, partial [SAR324 cluster bacterium]|nr:AMP-binding protein [SAR324 cluster bacterium]
LVSGLASAATLILYDGAPSFPDMGRLWRLIEDERITHFGISPKFLGTVQKSGYVPRGQHDLSSLRSLMSTGSTLPEELFEWVYQDVADQMPLMSISGGTDLVGCFMLGNPNLPVYSGEIQCKALSMGTEAFTPEGQSTVGEKGELVCTTPFPSMPVFFWNDEDGAKYRKAYFERFPNVWTHGDFIEITERGGVIVHGRSDTVLNPGGVRIGTAEIYRPVEAMAEVVDSLVVGQPWEEDVRVVLFVVLQEETALEADLEQRIRQQIRTYATPRHVPARILTIPDVPRTISGKKVEKAVLQVLQGEVVENTAALANPESLDTFRQLRDDLRNA